MAGGFVDGGVPVVHLLQVEGEIAVDVDVPPGLAQAWQAFAGKAQPGFVVWQLEHFAGAVRQGLALSGGGLEAQVAQHLAQRLLGLRLAADALAGVVDQAGQRFFVAAAGA